MRYPEPANWFEFLSSPGTVQRLYWEAADNSFRDLGFKRLAIHYPEHDAKLGRVVERWMDRIAEQDIPVDGLSHLELFDDYCRLAHAILVSDLEVAIAKSDDIATHLAVARNRHAAALRTATFEWSVGVVTLIFAANLCEIAHALLVRRVRSPKLAMDIPNSSVIAKHTRTLKHGPRSEALIYEAVQEIARIPSEHRVSA